MFNKITILGNLTKDVKLTTTQGGTNIVTNTIVSSHKKMVNGELKEENCFLDIVVFGKMAENMNQYLRKGSKVFVEGRLTQDTWQDKEGKTRYSYKVIVETMKFLDSKPKAEHTQAKPNQAEAKEAEVELGEDEGVPCPF
ncbi:single-stranded DNA-binding protein [Campylobacter helveticus]|uniref:Single-stranded DNA-binding protein n=1 Tax=Campylobacter helveticus TaxID=28898 RepID=A0ABY3L2K1_9BACT|nr:single-stranded DNA-binding protein [Campylobacter helveticus]MCR2039381.1 single-stranded DNA-binding protein [Campylobacter helveticus]TXK57723.1 single-stranded DNA-binding protein [Campylobacter helveticus]